MHLLYFPDKPNLQNLLTVTLVSDKPERGYRERCVCLKIYL